MLPTLTAPEARAFGQTVCLADLIDAPAFHMRVSGVGRDGEQMMIVEVPAFWVDSLPGPDQVGFFFPIATEAALRRLPFGCFAPGFDPGTEGIDEGVYFPKAQGQSSTRIAEIELLGVAQSLGQEETDTYAKALSACLGPMPMPGASEGIGAKGDGWLTHLRSEDQLAQCEAISGVIPEIRRHQFVTKRDSLAWHVTAEGKVEPLDKTVPLPSCMRSGSDSIPVFADLRHAMIYLPEGIDIISARDIILGYKWPFEFSRPTATDPNAAVLSEKNIFDFAPSYERAIARFAYLEELASHLRLPLGLALGVLAMLLVVILLFGTINNRRTEFGWLMAEGRSMRFVRGFFMAQLCVVLALVVPTGLAFYWFAADVLNVHFERSQAVDLAEKQLGQVDLFVIDPSSSTMIWPVVMTFVLTVIALPMIFGPLRLIFQSKHRQSPIRLISS
ncbi:hypothetical protein SSE37_01655 [Sagittula stellata E-37]|uniref:Uncharacterized protein n=2 Tax=Sagittula stellata TaxID=52603 RepID=A3K4L9_SAGS3|nr:hypothetical protein SSE37_01655 [Sagittula stellata E-37]